MKRGLGLTAKWIAGVIAALVILCAVLIGLFRLLAPLVPGYREQVQTWATVALGYPVRIAGMGAVWDLYGPELTLENVELLSKDRERVVIAAREIRLGFTPRALLYGQFSRPSHIILIQPQLELERDTDGSIGVLGLEGSLELSREHTDWRQVAADSFAQNAKVLIRRGQVTLIDARTPAAAMVFSDIRMDLDNSADNHRISGRLLLPLAFGKTLSFSSRIQGTGQQPQAWQWQAEMQGTGLKLPQLLSYWSDYTRRFSSGTADLRAAVSGAGAQLNHAQADINVHQLIPVGDTASNGGFSLLAGELNWNRSAGGWTLSGNHIELRRAQEIWPVSKFNLQYAQAAPASVSWSGTASFLRVQDMVTLAAWLPEKYTSDTARLRRLSPSGDVTDLKFQAQWNGKTFNSWSLDEGFSGLGLHADGDIPGFSGMDGKLAVNQDGGTLQLDGQHASVDFPHLFRGPLMATALSARVQLHHDDQGWLFSTDDFSATNPDIQQATAKGTLLLPADGSSPVIDLRAQAENVSAANKSLYLPVGIMPKEVVDWLDSAIAGGQVPHASLILRGKLHDFPYANGQGLFDIRFHLVHGVLDYAAGWPRVENLEADVEFKNQGMSVAVLHGSVLGDDISGATARFMDLRNGILELKGSARGSAETALTFLRTGPLKKRFGHYLDDLQAGGRSDVSLNLTLPVEHVERFKLDGHAVLRNVSLTMSQLENWPLDKLNGDVEFTGIGVSANQLSGEFLGAPINISLRPDAKQDMTLVSAEGGVNAAQISAAVPALFNKTLTGSTTWKLTGQVPNDPATSSSGLALTLTSDLRGLGVDLPAPFGKSTDAAMSLKADLGLTGDNQMLMQLRYGNILSGVGSFTDVDGGFGFERGDLVFGGGSPSLPAAAGLVIAGTLPEFSLDAWKPYMPQSSSVASWAFPPFLLAANLDVGHFSGFDQDIDNLHVRLARATDGWRLDLESTPVAGQIRLPYHSDAAHPIVADMQRVTLISKAVSPRKAIPKQLNPHVIPPLQLSIRQLHYGDVRLDNVHAELEPQAQGVNLKTLSVANPDFKASGSGRWIVQPDGKQDSSLSLQLQSSDIGKTLQAFGFAPGITGDSGELQADLNWPGGPLADILPVLNGKLHLKLKNGRLLEVKPGAGRLFGLLSINALPRRLLLNFSDVLGKGFGYDSIQGNFLIENGDAYTNNLTVSGPAARIHLIGRTGLAKHDFDEALIVDPNVGAALPVLGALAASSLGVGAVLFVLTEIFKKPLSTAGEIRYRLTGTWDNPILTNVPESQPAANKQY